MSSKPLDPYHRKLDSALLRTFHSGTAIRNHIFEVKEPERRLTTLNLRPKRPARAPFTSPRLRLDFPFYAVV